MLHSFVWLQMMLRSSHSFQVVLNIGLTKAVGEHGMESPTREPSSTRTMVFTWGGEHWQKALDEAREFGVMQVDEERRIVGFEEKPASPTPIPDDPEFALASMGIYIFTTDVMYEWLCREAVRPDSHHDFGRDIIPEMIAESGSPKKL